MAKALNILPVDPIHDIAEPYLPFVHSSLQAHPLIFSTETFIFNDHKCNTHYIIPYI